MNSKIIIGILAIAIIASSGVYYYNCTLEQQKESNLLKGDVKLITNVTERFNDYLAAEKDLNENMNTHEVQYADELKMYMSIRNTTLKMMNQLNVTIDTLSNHTSQYNATNAEFIKMNIIYFEAIRSALHREINALNDMHEIKFVEPTGDPDVDCVNNFEATTKFEYAKSRYYNLDGAKDESSKIEDIKNYIMTNSYLSNFIPVSVYEFKNAF